MRSYQSSQEANFIGAAGITSQLVGEPDLQALMGSAYIGQLNVPGTVGGLMQTLAREILNRMVYRDNPRISQTLTSLNVLVSLEELIYQMRTAPASVPALTITAAAQTQAETGGQFATGAPNTGVGNGVMVASVRRPFDGRVLENSFQEDLRLTCTSDSFVGGATEGNEPFSVEGTGQQTDVFAFDWPLGSGASTTLNAIDGSADNAEGNLLTNSSFDDFTGDTPDNWTVAVGTAGTHVFKETGTSFDGGTCLRITGDGSNLTQLRQQFDTSTGTSGVLDELAQYSVCLWLRRDGTAPAAGVLTVDLVDGSFVAISDMNSPAVANSFTIDLTTLSTDWTSYTGVFRTPLVLPATAYIRLRLSTALTNGRSVYIDRLGLGVMTQVYTSGPSVSVHSGSTAFRQGNFGEVAVTSSRGRGTSATLDLWPVVMVRLFYNEIMGEELLIPSSSTASISNDLITR